MISKKSSEAAEEQISILLRMTAGSLGLACALLGAAVMTSWMLQGTPGLTGPLPMQFNSAFGFLLCGVSLLTLTFRLDNVGGVFAIATTVLAALALAEFALGFPFNISSSLITRPESIKSLSFGMPPDTAAYFFFSGLALLLASRQRGAAFMGILGSVEAALAFVPLIGFLTGGDSPSLWGDLSHLIPLCAAGLFGLGAGLLSLAWSQSTRRSLGGPPWAKYAVSIGILSLSLIQWHVLGKQERDSLNKTIQRELQELKAAIVSDIEPKTLALLRMAKRREAFSGMPREQWQKDAAFYVAHRSFEAVHWIDRDLKPRWSATEPGHDHYDLSGEITPNTLEQIHPKTALTLRLPRKSPSGPQKLLALHPLYHKGEFDGMIVGVLDFDALIKRVSTGPTERGYSAAIFDGPRTIYGPSTYPHRLAEWLHQARVTPFNLSWILRIWPRQETLAGLRSPLPRVVLGVGILTAFLLGLTVQLAQSERIKAVELEKINRGLSSEVKKRNQAELELRKNRDRLEEMVLERTADLEETQRQLADKEALAAVGSMAAVMAHEIRNPLGSIVTAAKSLVKETLSGEDRKTLISVLGHETHRLDKTLRDFLFYARPRDPKRTMSDLNSTVREILSAIRSDEGLMGNVEIAADLSKRLTPFAFDPDQIRQILWNLIINALQAMNGQGRIEITTRSHHGRALFTVEDSGPGIPAETLKKIFQPFHTTKQQGNGLGLAIALRIARAHGGRIEATSKPGQGARFSVYLPTVPTNAS